MTAHTRAIFLTAYDRPNLLESVLESWNLVRGTENWDLIASIEPGPKAEEIASLFAKTFIRPARNHRYRMLFVNPERYGVLHHPWVRFDYLFRAGYEFVVRAEDDLLVSDDTLEYFEWADDVFRNDQSVATVHAYSAYPSEDPEGVVVRPEFNPLVWGTWRDRWESFMRDTWDHDYSTNNGIPGVQAGWDWNLNTRIFPQRGLSGVYPTMSRVSNIGIYGTHSTPENFYTAPSFQSHYGVVRYDLLDSPQ